MSRRLKLVASILCGAKLVCPAVYEDEDGSFVIQGKKLRPEDRVEIGPPEDEEVVRVPRELLMETLKKL